mgnify:CR=1 FL=1
MNKYSKIRVSVRGICIIEDKMLFQTDLNDKVPVYATLGGELEPGEKMEERLKLEFMEEAGTEIEILKYLFVIENFLIYNDQPIHSLEHYFLIKLPSEELTSRESHLSFHWLPVKEIRSLNIKPQILKDIILKGELEDARHFIAE